MRICSNKARTTGLCWARGEWRLGEEAQMEDTHLGGEIGRVQATHGHILRLSEDLPRFNPLIATISHMEVDMCVIIFSHGSPERKQNAGSMSQHSSLCLRKLRKWNRFVAYLDNHWRPMLSSHSLPLVRTRELARTQVV